MFYLLFHEFRLNNYTNYFINAFQHFSLLFFSMQWKRLGINRKNQKATFCFCKPFLFVKYRLIRDQIHNFCFIFLTRSCPSNFAFSNNLFIFTSVPNLAIILSIYRIKNDEANVTLRTRIVLEWFSFRKPLIR